MRTLSFLSRQNLWQRSARRRTRSGFSFGYGEKYDTQANPSHAGRNAMGEEADGSREEKQSGGELDKGGFVHSRILAKRVARWQPS